MSTPSTYAFRSAYKEWLLVLAETEAKQGCPRFSTFKGELPMYFMDVTATWSDEERYHLMCARMKRAEAAYVPVELSPEEEGALGRFDWPFMQHLRTPGKPSAVHVSRISGKVREIDAEKIPALARSEATDLGDYRIEKRKLQREIRAAMKLTCGEPLRGGAVWTYPATVDNIKIETDLDFGARLGQFRYSHALFPQGLEEPRKPRQRLLTAQGICELLGYPASEWHYVTDGDIPATAALVAQLCREFVDAVPRIIERAAHLDLAAPQ